MTLIFNLLLLWGFFAILMVGVYFIYLKINRPSYIDVAWSFGFLFFLLLSWILYPQFHILKVVVTAMMSFWSLRLGIYLVKRLQREEDGRYLELIDSWKPNLKQKFFVFFQFQGVSIPLLGLPLLLVFSQSSLTINTVTLFGVGLWFLSFIFESVADFQLESFRTNPKNKGEVCQLGLWKYSRHPNYFFEWMMWVCYALIAFGQSGSLLGFVSPALMLFFILQMTGIPPTEKQSIKSRGDKYRAYQRKTSAFVPWFPKK